MLKREPIQTAVNHERWLVSYADFITLLFAFFVVMYSVSSVNESKYQAVFEQFQSAFPKVDQVGDVPLQSLAPDAVDTLISEIHAFITQSDPALLGLTDNEKWVDITLDAHMLFDTASAELSQQAMMVLSDISATLTPLANSIQVRGHTDNIPINSGLYKNNWALSSARAVAVVSFLVEKGIAPLQLTAVGLSKYDPIDTNDTEYGRKNNRRVVIRILKNLPSNNLQSKSSDLKNLADKPRSTAEQAADKPNKGDANQLPIIPQPTATQQTYDKANAIIKPVKLNDGGLLFTSDGK